MNERKEIVTFKGSPVTLLGDEIKVGDKAPMFKALNKDLEEFNLEDYKGKVLIITSFPSVDTGICSIQLSKFNNEAAEYKDDVNIVTISADLPFALSRFCAANGISNAITLSDHRDLDFGYKYGVVMKELRLLARTIFIIDKEGIVRYFEIAPEIGTHLDYDKSLEELKKLV